MQEVRYFIDRKRYKIYFVRDSIKDGYNLRLLAQSRNPAYPSYLYTQSGDKFDFSYRLDERIQQGIQNGVKMHPLTPANKHLLPIFFVKVI